MKESIKKPVTAVYVEDEEDWREDVSEYIKRHCDIEFSRFITGSTIDDVRKELSTLSGLTILIVDLMLGKERINFLGYHWLLDDMKDFVRDHTNTAVFVVSGQLHQGIVESLVRRGIPENHIFDKGEWAEKRKNFIEVLNEAVDKMDDIALRNIQNGMTSKNVDPHLVHAFHEIENQDLLSPKEGLVEEEPLLPMLVRTVDQKWNYIDIPGLQVLGHIDNIYSCMGSKGALIALESDPSVIDIEASRSLTQPECHVSIPYIKAEVVHHDRKEKGDNCLLAFIDSDIDVLHEAFRDSNGQSRIWAIWDQTDPTGPSPKGFDKGTLHTHEQIDAYVKQGQVPGNLIPRDHHGTHVVSIASGRATENFSGGVAPESKILVVIPDMDAAKKKPRSLGYSVSHHLALEFIKELRDQLKLPVVVNISQGMNAGAHDGTSNLEKGFDKITDNGQIPGICIIKSAGNERNRCGHAKLKLALNNQDDLIWNSQHDHWGEDIVDLWFDAGDRFRFSVVDPNEEGTQWVDWSHLYEEKTFLSGNRAYITYTRFDQDNGDSRLLITVTPGKATRITPGKWKLCIQSISIKSSGEIHAWLERDNFRPSKFLNHISEETTLSVPGTANYIVTVGAIAATFPTKLCEFSSLGPTRDGRSKPEVAAPGEGIVAAKSASGDGTVSMSGTSMAAPHVSGAIALLFSYWERKSASVYDWHQLNAAQIMKIVALHTQNRNPIWHPGMGYGILDVEAIFSDF